MVVSATSAMCAVPVSKYCYGLPLQMDPQVMRRLLLPVRRAPGGTAASVQIPLFGGGKREASYPRTEKVWVGGVVSNKLDHKRGKRCQGAPCMFAADRNICIKRLVSPLHTGVRYAWERFGVALLGGVNSNPRARMRTQGPENPSQFRVQATTALTDEGSAPY